MIVRSRNQSVTMMLSAAGTACLWMVSSYCGTGSINERRKPSVLSSAELWMNTRLQKVNYKMRYETGFYIKSKFLSGT